MPIDKDALRIQLMFNTLDKTKRSSTFPVVGSLSSALNELVANDQSGSKTVNNKIIGNFATASVEMWDRALHSFLISASLTKSSPIWASVVGYYSSHYIMRAFAHLLGFYQLFNKKVFVRLELQGQNYLCHISKKNDREHKLYWKLVKDAEYFADDPFFYYNIDTPPFNSKSEFKSDGGHRNKANYSDHVGNFPNFSPLDEKYLKERILTISGIELNDVPIPNISHFPDLDNVQLIAYHRIVKYRSFLDNLLPVKNRFWSVQRNPNWCSKYIDFQVVQPEFTTIYSEA